MTKKKKWENPHKREYGIEIVRRENEPIVEDIVYKLSIDIGFATSGLTFFNRNTGEVKSIYYKNIGFKENDDNTTLLAEIIKGAKDIKTLKLKNDFTEPIEEEVIVEKVIGQESHFEGYGMCDCYNAYENTEDSEVFSIYVDEDNEIVDVSLL